jgi:integrase
MQVSLSLACPNPKHGNGTLQDRITASLVRKLLDAPPAKDTSVFDVVMQRFALRVKPPRRPGAKPAAWFFVRYTSREGTERRKKVGDPTTMSVDEARRAARAVLAVVDAGGDPRAEQRRRRATPTIRQLAQQYLGSPEFSEKTLKVQANDRARIKTHIVQHIGPEKADAVTSAVVRRLRRLVETDTRTNNRKRRLGGPGAARKVIRLLSALLRWAKDNGHIHELPFTLRELDLGGDGARDAVITSSEEYARLFDTMAGMVAAGSLRPEVRAFFALVASTGLRRGEAQELRWGQVNLGRRQITLTNSKGAKLARGRGKVQSKTEIVGLPPIAAFVLAEIMPETPAETALVFAPSQGEQLSVNRDWIAVREAAGLPADLTLHGLRHSVGTVGATSGMSMPELQALLRHKQPSTTSRYIHMAQMAGGLADKAMGGVLPSVDAPSAIVPLRREAG